MTLRDLPIDSTLPQLRQALNSSLNAVLVAPPGAGKTTRVPLALLDEPWLDGKRVLMLEPRRLATRMASRYMAASLGELVGETVGYRVRSDTHVGPSTRIEVVTDGVFTRLIQADPSLEGVGLVIFDEFHERALQADLGLALCLQAQAVLRDDLRILVMSATMNSEAIAALLDDAPIITSQGRSYPVETHYLETRPKGRPEMIVVRAILKALEENQGDLLVFLPGTGEIRRVMERLAEVPLGPHIKVVPLYGDLSAQAQDLAIAPCQPGERKVVLSTSIAETSLTVEGIQCVIDSGLMRTPRFSSRTGMTRLVTIPVSQASADQRRGRAGRLGPGICYRLWTEHDQVGLVPYHTPEIMEADLAPLVLELAAWGVMDPTDLRWLNPPPNTAFQQGVELLTQLGAMDSHGAITDQGRRMVAMGLHPRLAHMILKAIPMGLGSMACDLAALLSERDIFRKTDQALLDVDLRLRIEVLHDSQTEDSNRLSYQGYRVDSGALRRVRSEAERWKREWHIQGNQKADVNTCGLLLAWAYPDRIASRREIGSFLLCNGRGSCLDSYQALAQAPYLVAAELDDQGANSRIFLASPIELSELEEHFADDIVADDVVAWDPTVQAVRGVRRTYLGALVLHETALPKLDAEAVKTALHEGIAIEGLRVLPWTRPANQLRQRLLFMQLVEPGWPDVSDTALIATLHDWLGPHLYNIKSRADLQRLNLTAIFMDMLSWNQRRELDMYAPTHLVVPSGSRIPIDYSDPATPVLAVRLQEVFGLTDTPCIGHGKVSLSLHLLSPAGRPVQVTRDLASFWRTTYFEVRKDLRGRYPKHYWPDDPLTAIATHRTGPTNGHSFR